MEDVSILNETFRLYYEKAGECLKNGNKLLAKRYYMLAAEQMLKMAKADGGDALKQARYQRAKSIIDFAESIAVVSDPSASKQAGATPPRPRETEKISVEEALSRLNGLVGLDTVKTRVSDWVDQIKVFRLREQRGLPVPEMSYHMVFTGNPGTGKTTVARIMGQIYCALGILSEGHLVEVSRGDLVAGYVGQTAVKTKEVLQSAYGGVLFIDEAYSLASDSANDFGREAVETILKEMEDRRGDFAVIVAGYDDLMEKFINSNPGLRSRFKNFIRFPDYTGAEMFRIFLSFCEKNRYRIERRAQAVLRTYFNALYQNRDDNFGNARDVRNLFESIVTNQSRRVVRLTSPTDEDMITIRSEDLPFTDLFLQEEDIMPPSQASDAEAKGADECVKERTPQDEAAHSDETTPENAVLRGKEADNEFRFDWDSLPAIGFDDIAGLEEVKEAVRVKVLLPLQHPEVFEGYERRSGGGLLLYGPPGTGKTMIAAAIANEIGAKFCSIKPSDLLNQGVGNTEKAIRALFSQARSFPCAVIYFDEMDSISPKSTKSQYARQLRSELLAQMQGIDAYREKEKNILFLIAATNKPWDIDSAFIRPGRFGTRVYVGLPDAEARRYMLNKRLEKIRKKGIVSVDESIDLDAIVEKTNGFNGSDMTNLIDRAEEVSALRGIGTGKKTLCGEDFDRAMEQITSSVQKADIEKLMQWKEEN